MFLLLEYCQCFFVTLSSGVKGWGASGYIKKKTRNAVENKTNTNEKQHKRNTLKYSGNTELLVLFRVCFLRFTTKNW